MGRFSQMLLITRDVSRRPGQATCSCDPVANNFVFCQHWPPSGSPPCLPDAWGRPRIEHLHQAGTKHSLTWLMFGYPTFHAHSCIRRPRLSCFAHKQRYRGIPTSTFLPHLYNTLAYEGDPGPAALDTTKISGMPTPSSGMPYVSSLAHLLLRTLLAHF